MALFPQSASLTQRLITNYTIVSAATLVVVTGVFFLTDSMPIRACVAGTSLLCSIGVCSVLMPATIKSNQQIHNQLEAFPIEDGGDWHPEPVAGIAPVEQGWNRLVETARCWRLLSQLEQRVDQSLFGGMSSGFPSVINALSEGLAVTDRDNEILSINNAFAAICDSEAGELVGLSLEEILPTSIELSDFRGNTRPMIQDYEHGDGVDQQFFQLCRRPQLSSGGEVEGFVWLLRDVTQQHLAEDAREQFVAAATHELRTPLASIRAYAETLATRENINREQQNRFYNVIQSEASRLGRFIDDLLDVSRMQAGSLSLDCHETDLSRLINETVEKIRPSMEAKQLDFRVELPAKIPMLNIDKGKVSAALVNLLGNAAKYTPESGRVTLRVSSSSQRIELAVTDSGIGIAADELPNIFGRFFRSEDDRVQEMSGSGLGLTFTQEVARLHGGDVKVESELDKGSTFCMTLPVSAGA
ncbi:sensor histidine kinase [Thalassoroseus pseudoceratinae]|uniref:sensor histidine kinase n=1 Tax=Thalassoroseus pseudoceratinae TaxID=2713176 RepID=UPI00141FEBF6|nr:ATP-binding protein [Thalassoroseus pseudoceratinae]